MLRGRPLPLLSVLALLSACGPVLPVASASSASACCHGPLASAPACALAALACASACALAALAAFSAGVSTCNVPAANAVFQSPSASFFAIAARSTIYGTAPFVSLRLGLAASASTLAVVILQSKTPRQVSVLRSVVAE